MIKEIVKLLSVDDWVVGSDTIDIAKGKYAIPSNMKEYRTQRKRDKCQ